MKELSNAMKMNHSSLAKLTSGLMLGVAMQVTAAPLPIGDTVIAGTTVAAQPELAGVVLQDTLKTYDFSGNGEVLKGYVQNRVVRSDVDGTLDFYWRIIPDTNSTGGIVAFRVTGFGELAHDANFRIDGLGDVALNIARNFGGGSVNFIFDTEVGPANTSKFFFIDTLVTNYAELGSYDLLCADSNCVSSLFVTFSPSLLPVDTDGDGVQDVDDECPNTPAGEVVNTNGCSISQLVPCEGPASGGTWKNHGKYVSTLTKVAKSFYKQGLITAQEKGQIVSEGARSDCGKKEKKPKKPKKQH